MSTIINPKISKKELYLFCSQFSALLNAGLNIVDILESLIEQTKNKILSDSLKKIKILLSKGYSLSQAMSEMENIFPDILIKTIESGEWSGTINESFTRMADYFERQYKIQQKIRGAISYPLFLLFASLFIVIFLLKIVIPQFIEKLEYQNVNLPYSTKLLIRITSFFENNIQYILLIMSIFIFIFLILLNNKNIKIKIDKILLKVPIIGELNKKVICSNFNRTMAILLSSGIPINHSIIISSEVCNNEFVKNKLILVSKLVEEGESFYSSLKGIDIFDTNIINIIAIGEESGQLVAMMNKIAALSEVETEESINNITKFIEPILILIIGALIAFIAISTLMPMLNIYDAL